MEIKRLDETYLEDIIAIEKENFPSDFWKREDWIELISDKDCFYFACLCENKIAANIFVYKNPDGYIKIMNIGVRKEFRGNNLAAKLLTYVTDTFTKEGYKTFYGETRKSNLAMQKSFEKAGYSFRCLAEDMYESPKEDGYKYQLLVGDNYYLTKIGKCGFYCGSCPSYPIKCLGCVSGNKGGVCYSRDCVLEKEIGFCGQCSEFPCDEIIENKKSTVLDESWLRWKRKEKNK